MKMKNRQQATLAVFCKKKRGSWADGGGGYLAGGGHAYLWHRKHMRRR